MKKFLLRLALVISLPILGILLLYISLSLLMPDDLPKDEKISIKVTVKTGKILAEKRNLRFDGWGGSGVGEVKMMAISLTSTDGPFDIEKARELVVYCTKIFLKEINNSEEIRPYLHNYPFTPANVKVSIFCTDKKNNEAKPPFIACVAARQKNICYYIDNGVRFERVHEESYEDALKILKQQED